MEHRDTQIAAVLSEAEALEGELPTPAALPGLPQGAEIAAWIDQTLLKPEASPQQVEALCVEAAHMGFASVCINPVYVPLAARILAGSRVRVCTVVGFPLGASLMAYKAVETLGCLAGGASEIDMVLHIGGLKGEAYGPVLADIQGVTAAARSAGALVKVILETGLLTRREKIIACLLCREAGADFVKTSTGFGSGGATVEDIDLMHRVVGPALKVKASGGVRSLADTLAMIAAGASRIGTSAGVKIVSEAIGQGLAV
jgi:deoxyribose-phosphate aldolase